MPDLIYERHPEGSYAIFTMSRPDRLNALGRRMLEEFAAALEDFENDPDMRCGVVTGTGRAFSAGIDLKEMAEASTAKAEIEYKFERGEISEEEQTERLKLLAFWEVSFRLSSPPETLYRRDQRAVPGRWDGTVHRLRYSDCLHPGIFRPVRSQTRGYGQLRGPTLAPYYALRRSDVPFAHRRPDERRGRPSHRLCARGASAG